MSKAFNEKLLKSLEKAFADRSRKTADNLNEYERTECMPFPGPVMSGLNTAQWGVTTENYKAGANSISFEIVAHNSQQPYPYTAANGKLVGEIGNMAAVRFELGNYNVYPKKANGTLVWWNRRGQPVFRARRRYAARGHRYYHNDILRILKEFGGKRI